MKWSVISHLFVSPRNIHGSDWWLWLPSVIHFHNNTTLQLPRAGEYRKGKKWRGSEGPHVLWCRFSCRPNVSTCVSYLSRGERQKSLVRKVEEETLCRVYHIWYLFYPSPPYYQLSVLIYGFSVGFILPGYSNRSRRLAWWTWFFEQAV